MNVYRSIVGLAAVAVALVVVGLRSPSPLAADAKVPSFTAGQAAKGRALFSADCAQCHGVNLQGISGPALRGADSNLATQSVSAIYTYVSTEMPMGNAGGLKADEYVSLLAFLLEKNGHRPGSAGLSVAALKASTAKFGGVAMK